MKKVIVSFILTAVLAFSTYANAFNGELNPTMAVISSSTPNKFVLDISGFKAQKVKFTIYDKAGKVLYSRNLTQMERLTKYDMSNNPEGIYEVQLEDQLKVESYTLTMTKDALEISKEKKVDYKPVFIQKNRNEVGLNLLALGKKVNIKITEGENLIFQESLSGLPVISKVYDLRKSSGKNCLFTISIDGNYYYHEVNL